MDRPLASYIDHTLLKPDATESQVRTLVAEAAEAGFACAMVPPCWVRLAAEGLAGTAVAAATVIGFPFGYVDARARVAESVQAVTEGARELDTVINLSFLKSGDDRRAADDLGAWVGAMRALRGDGLVLKVIVETALLTGAEKRRAAEMVAASGADFVKTSTGFGPGGATIEDVRLLAEVAAGRCRVKASGGIRDLAAARAMIAAGADRLGTSSGRAILAEAAGG